MQALKRDLVWARHQHTPDLSGGARNLLNTLRLAGRQCRAKRRQNLFEACAVLSADKRTSSVAIAETLARCLPQALGKTPVLYRPGEGEVSFDEAWVLQLASAIAQDNEASAAFLLRSRVLPHARRQLRFLIGSLADRLNLI